MTIPTINDVFAAAECIAGQAHRTPLLEFNVLNARVGCRVFVKAENLQRTGSFKFRGAYNAISNMSAEERAGGIIAASSGNHAQGVAAVAQIFDVQATIIMPSDAPKIKIDRTKSLGATVIEYDRSRDDREQILQDLVKETNKAFVHPYNDPKVIAGQGTVGLEIAEDLNRLGIAPERMLVCTGGGGLTAGVALAIKHSFPDVKLHSCEPEGFDDYKRSLEQNTPLNNKKTSGSICDAVLTPSPGDIGFTINQSLLSDGLIVSDQQALEAVKFAHDEMKMVIEPGGAVALAAALKYGPSWDENVIALTLSGGNIDPDTLQVALNVTT